MGQDMKVHFMPSFSERHGYIAAKSIQFEAMDQALRTSLWNFIDIHFFQSDEDDLEMDAALQDFARILYDRFHKKAVRSLPFGIDQFIAMESERALRLDNCQSLRRQGYCMCAALFHPLTGYRQHVALDIAPLETPNFAFAQRGQDQKLERPRHQAPRLSHSRHEGGHIAIRHRWVVALDQGASLGQQERQRSLPSGDIGLGNKCRGAVPTAESPTAVSLRIWSPKRGVR
jgi:hypothetical protein